MGTDPAVDFAQMKKLADKSVVFWYDCDHKKGVRSNRPDIAKEIGGLADNIIGLLKRAECID
jgi:hypothetical protein